MASKQSAVPRRRLRPAASCVECRRRKIKCERTRPCCQCIAQNFECRYTKYGREVFEHGGSHYPAATTARNKRCQSPPGRSKHSSDQTVFNGTISKTRVFGPGHWMSAFKVLSDLSSTGKCRTRLGAILQRIQTVQQGSLATSLMKCKELAREVKNRRPQNGLREDELHISLPDHIILDKLVDLYFETFEMCFTTLYRPSFAAEYRKYKDRPAESRPSFTIRLTLVAAIAAILHPDIHIRAELARKTDAWIDAAQIWLYCPSGKDRLTLAGVQAGCLLALARQVCQRSADVVWVSFGSTVRMAMQMGLHIDPDHLGDMSSKQKEIRRRLWYTVLELNIQASLDSGMVPMVRADDFSTRMPGSASDADLETGSVDHPAEIDTHSRTTAFQSLMAASMPLRLKTVHLMNDLQKQMEYSQIFTLGESISEAVDTIASKTRQLEQTSGSDTTAAFGLSFCSHLFSRIIQCLHFNFALKAFDDPTYSHSQKTCLRISLELISLLDEPLYGRVLTQGGGMFRDIMTRAFSAIYLELAAGRHTALSPLAEKQRLEHEAGLIRNAELVAQHSAERLHYRETNVKGYIFCHIAIMQIKAVRNGDSEEKALDTAAQHCVETCESILKSKLDQLCVSDVSDHVSGQTPRQDAYSMFGDLDFDFDTGLDDFDFPSMDDNSFWQ